MTPEDLAKLTAGCVKFVPGTGDTPEPTNRTQIAAALSGLSREAYLLAVSKWIQDKSVQSELFYRLYVMVTGIAAREKWKVHRGRELLRGLTRLAMIEFVMEPRCPRCNGTTCRRCGYTGYLRLSDRERANVVGIDQSNWSRVWNRRYVAVAREIQGYESEVWVRLKKERRFDNRIKTA